MGIKSIPKMESLSVSQSLQKKDLKTLLHTPECAEGGAGGGVGARGDLGQGDDSSVTASQSGELASRLNSALNRSGGKKGSKNEINPAAIKEKLDRIK